jgi:hypothetical protein
MASSPKVVKLYKPLGWQLPSKVSGLYLPVPDEWKAYRL